MSWRTSDEARPPWTAAATWSAPTDGELMTTEEITVVVPRTASSIASAGLSVVLAATRDRNVLVSVVPAALTRTAGPPLGWPLT